MRKHLIKNVNNPLSIYHAGVLYVIPKKVADKYRVTQDDKKINSEEIFAKVNKKYTRPGALLKGIRIREGLTQIAMAKCIKVTQSDISQMEKGIRKIGRTVAKRIEKQFKVNYRSFLD